MRIVWTAPALLDLTAARANIARDNSPVAERHVGRVLAAAAILLQFPEIGRPGLRPGTRELVVSRTPYAAAYRLRGDMIEILRVLHGRQRWTEALT
jgi:toxin ParE1/3/4